MSAVYALLLLLAIPALAHSWQSGCFFGPPLLLLPLPQLIPPGFVVPGANFSNASAVAAICSPSPLCSSLRLLGQYCPTPQGLFEPEVCPQGMYCPSIFQKLVCPAGSFCPLGSSAPIACSPFSICTQGSHRELFFGPAALAVGIDIAIISLLYSARLCYLRRAVAAGARPSDSSNNIAPLPQPLSSSELTQHLVSRIRSACGFSGASGAQRPAVDLAFEGVSLSFGSKGILQGVWGRAASGKLTAIMGGSGSGKSTLLHCLRGRLKPDSGTITINGAAATLRDIQQMVGFCAQDDDVFLLPSLTVEETLKFAALTRMPRACSAEDRTEYVDTLILKLGLHRVRHSLIGSYGGSSISGGERRRVSLGVALAGAPLCLFLDEPTSGLDSSSALSLFQLLKELAVGGLTVVAVVHQPRAEVFAATDDLIVLGAGGCMFYSGPSADAKLWLEAAGVEVRSDCNIADIVIDAATASARLRAENGIASSAPICTTDPRPVAALITATITLSQLRAARAQSPRFTLQAVAFMCRSLLQQRRELSTLYLELFLSFLSGSLMGATSGGSSIFTGVLIEPFSLMSPAPALFSLPLLSFFIGLTIGVSASPPAVRVFGDEKHLVRSEGAAGCSRSAYYVGKSLSVLPRLTLCAFHFSSIFYLLMGPRASFSSVFAAIWSLNYCVYGLAAFLSVLSREGNSALLSVIVSMALAALCGYSPSLADASSWGASILWDLQCVPPPLCLPAAHSACRYTRWVAEAFFFSEVQPWTGVYDTKQPFDVFGYSPHRWAMDIGIAFAIGTVYRIAALPVLLWHSRSTSTSFCSKK